MHFWFLFCLLYYLLQEIEELCSHLRNNAALFKRLHVRPTTGVLLHCPPGCGKTLIARATAGVRLASDLLPEC